jgi:urea carboxylase
VSEAPSLTLDTRIVEVPVWYDDPFTNETAARFRDRHQRPEGNDLEFAAAENGLPSVQAFIDRHCGSPWLTSMVGFVAGLPFLFQMVPRERQLEVPKYLRPRTDTPPLTVGHGGCFACIYSVRGAGGYQMFGITPAPIFDPSQQLPDFADFMVFFRPGDIVKFRPIDQQEYERTRADVEAGTYRLKQAPVSFGLDDFLADPDAYNAQLLEALDGR